MLICLNMFFGKVCVHIFCLFFPPQKWWPEPSLTPSPFLLSLEWHSAPWASILGALSPDTLTPFQT